MFHTRPRIVVLSWMVLAVPACLQAGDAWLWWEGEDAVETNMTTRHAFSPEGKIQQDVLSGGKWLGSPASKPNPEYFARYEIQIPDSGEYAFYVRKFWKHGPFRFRFDDGPWQKVPRETALLENQSLRTHLTASWVRAGTVKLEKGKHTMRVELLPSENKAACFDAFLLTQRPFQPRGKLKPGQKLGKAPAGWFPFEPDWDTFKPSPIDLRYLNEKTAGDGGFIAVKEDQFVHSKTGKPVRFWAVNTGHELAKMDRSSIDTLARFLAKRGVNLVRIHGPFYEGSGPDATQIVPEKLDRIFYLIAALKREGIYTGMSIHFQHWLNLSQDKRVAGYDAQTHRPFAIHFFSPSYQEIFRGWWKAVLNTPNPYTGMTLAKDPAVAYCEIINEDNFFFWSFKPYDVVPAEQMRILESLYGDWLGRKYGSIAKAFDAWGQKPGQVQGDLPEQGRVGLYFVGMLTSNDWAVGQRNEQRARDQAVFLSHLQRDWFEEMRDYLKEDLGYGGPVCGSNMGTADHYVLLSLDKWTYTPCDFIDHHGYYGGLKKQAPPAHFGMSVGDSYSDRSLLRADTKDPAGQGVHFGAPFLAPMIENKPMVASEFAWILPNQYQSEMSFLAAVVGRTTGIDGQIFFALSPSTQWEGQMNYYWPINIPTVAGQWPAHALLYRAGLMAEAPTVVDARLSLKKLMQLKGAPVLPPKVGDDINEEMAPNKEKTKITQERIDPRTFYVGKVNISYDASADEHDISIDALDEYIDNENKVIRSATGEMVWQYGRGFMQVRADRAQGVAGFVSEAGKVDLPDMTIQSPMRFGNILAVSMDGKELTNSGKILLQVMSQAQDYAYQATNPGGLRKIVNRGAAPIIVKQMAGSVSFKRSDASKLRVTLLDFNGYPIRSRTGADKIELDSDVLYYLIEKP